MTMASVRFSDLRYTGRLESIAMDLRFEWSQRHSVPLHMYLNPVVEGCELGAKSISPLEC